MKRNFILIGLILCVSVAGRAQKKITIEDLYSKPTFQQQSVYGINWTKDGSYYLAHKGNDIVKYDVTTGEIVETILDGAKLTPSVSFDSYEFSDDQSKILLRTKKAGIYRRSFTAEYYIYDVTTGEVNALSEKGRQSYATFSPDGTRVAWVRKNDLYFKDLESGKETQVTKTGEFNKIINGSTDWVYEEELSFTRAFEWSGNSQSLIYLTFDESKVKEYNLQKWNQGQLYPEDYRFKYPKAGEVNSTASATIYQLNDGSTIPVNVGNGEEFYIARVRRTTLPDQFSLIRLNRLQNKLEILHVNAGTGDTRVVYTDKYDTYIDVDYVDDLTYLEDGKHFMMASERDGFKHLYLYTTEGKLVNQITQGDWEVKEVVGIDQHGKSPRIFYTSTEGSPLEKYFYAINLDGRKKEQLRSEKGMHSITMSNSNDYYIDYYSDAFTPLQVTLYKTKGNKKVKVLESNEQLVRAVEEYELSEKEFFTFKTVDSTVLHGYTLKPATWEEGKKYPVLIYQYSGPGSQNVTNSWGGSHYYWHQMLTQKGYIVAVIDSRGTGSRGAEFKKVTYGQLGKYEVQDLIEGARYLGNLPYVDAERIGIWGWSYGGYMSSLAILKAPEIFKAAIAVSPVTNWRYYDTIYTERYMGLPSENASGYDDNSPTSYAGQLEGNFLLIHGTGDDNVHFENSVALADALISEGKQFDSFYYPDRTHAIYSRKARPHLFRMMTNWLEENL